MLRLKERVMLVHAWITDTPLMGNAKMPETGFILGTPHRMYHFAAATVVEKNSWFQELHSAQKRLRPYAIDVITSRNQT